MEVAFEETGQNIMPNEADFPQVRINDKFPNFTLKFGKYIQPIHGVDHQNSIIAPLLVQGPGIAEVCLQDGGLNHRDSVPISNSLFFTSLASPTTTVLTHLNFASFKTSTKSLIFIMRYKN